MKSSIVSDSVTGSYLLVISGKSEYALFADKAGYLFNSINFDYHQSDLNEPLILDIQLQPINKGAHVSLNNIFFDINSYELLEKSKSELDQVVLFLQNNSTLKIEIGGHTDNTGNELYNQQLSLNRAKSVAAYVKDRGISLALVGVACRLCAMAPPTSEPNTIQPITFLILNFIEFYCTQPSFISPFL